MGRLFGSRRSAAERIDAVLDIVGLTDQSETPLAELTDGMAARLGIAVALLGDPKALLFDCPERGLELEGVAWLGALLRAFTGQGRAALVTGSDTETLVALADRVLLLDSGYLVGTRTAEEVLRAPTGAAVIVRSPQIVRFASILAESGARSTQGEGACLEVRGLDRARVGDLAYRHSIPVHELSERFTGSDPADVVLAACSGRNKPVVPFQGFPENGSPDSGAGILAGIGLGAGQSAEGEGDALTAQPAQPVPVEMAGTVEATTSAETAVKGGVDTAVDAVVIGGVETAVEAGVDGAVEAGVESAVGAGVEAAAVEHAAEATAEVAVEAGVEANR